MTYDPDFQGPSPKSGPGPDVSPPASGLAITSLISGIVSYICVPGIAALVAIVTGHMALGEIRRENGRIGGDAMAKIGLALGYINLLLCAIAVVLIALAAYTTVRVSQAPGPPPTIQMVPAPPETAKRLIPPDVPPPLAPTPPAPKTLPEDVFKDSAEPEGP